MLPHPPFVLCADAQLHTSDVKCLATDASASIFYSGSRDRTVRSSSLPDAGTEPRDTLVPALTLTGHQEFVNFVCVHPGLELLDGEPCVVTGSNDKHVALWSMASGAIEAVLDGHSQGVCCGAVIGDTGAAAVGTGELEWKGDIVSGDWSGMCLVFDHTSGKPKQVYQRHAVAVRGVAHLPGTTLVVSASGDKTIHLWDITTAATKKIYKGHEDVVQCICAIDACTFATGSNDSTVRVWTTATTLALRILHGHESLVYAVQWNPHTQELLSASEDHTVRVWGGAAGTAPGDGERFLSWEPRTVIPHPCVVWAVAAVSAEEVITGGSDGVVRLWTRDEDRMASIDKLEALQAAVSATEVDVRVAANAGAGGLDTSSMISVNELHLHRGSAEGEKKFARNESGAVEVYIWTAGRWDKIGVVVAGPDKTAYTGAPLAKEKKYFNGKEYDYVFDVDVEGKMLKLPYNAGENIFEAAQNFINSNSTIVTQDSKEAIQNFIMKHIDPQDLDRVIGPGYQPQQPQPQPQRAVWAGPAEPVPVAEFPSCEVFSSFKADGAQKKVNELLAPSTAFAGVMASLTAAVASGSTEARCAVVPTLAELFAALPEGKRFPALDAFAHLLSPADTTEAVLLAVLDALRGYWPPFGRGPASDSEAERLVTARLAANAFSVIDAGIRAGRAGALPPRLCLPLSWMLSDLPGFVYSQGAPSRNAALAVVRNGSRCLAAVPAAVAYVEGSDAEVVTRLRHALAKGIYTVLRAAGANPAIGPAGLTAAYTLLHESPHRTYELPPDLATNMRSTLRDMKAAAPFAEIAEAVITLLQV